MSGKSFLACEQESMEKLKKFQLPHYFKKAGLIIAVISLIGLFINKFTVSVPLITAITKYGMLVGLLLMSISKEKIEDELVIKLRMQSYSFAFIMGVSYALFLPFVDYLIDAVFRTKEANVTSLGGFVILWMLLSIQVGYFELLKKMQNA